MAFFITNLCIYLNLVRSRISDNNKSWISLDFQKEKDEIISLSQTVRLTMDNTKKLWIKQKNKKYSRTMAFGLGRWFETTWQHSNINS